MNLSKIIPGIVLAALAGVTITYFFIHPETSRGWCQNQTGSDFCDIGQSLKVNDYGHGRGISIVDINNDGLMDIWDTDAHGNVSIYLGSENTTPLTYGSPLDMGFSIEDYDLNESASFADADNDGDQDVLLVSGGYDGNGYLSLYENVSVDGIPEFRKVDESGMNQETGPWWSASWADVNLDGLLDVFVTASIDGTSHLYMNTGNMKFEESNSIFDSPPSPADTKNSVWLDLNNDRYPDLYVGGINQHFLYMNHGGESFEDVSYMLETDVIKENEIVSFVALSEDFNQDGYDDLYLGRWFFDDILYLGGSGGLTGSRVSEYGIDALVQPEKSENTMGLGAGDVNNDGYIDIIIGTGGPDRGYHDLIFCSDLLNGRLSFNRCYDEEFRQHGETRLHGIAFGDIDNDGLNEMVMNTDGPKPNPIASTTAMNRHNRVCGGKSLGPNMIYDTQAQRDKRITSLFLTGSLTNKDAIGAKVKIEDGDTIAYRTIRSSQGFQSQGSKVISYPASSKSLSVTVYWPSEQGAISRHEISAGGIHKLTDEAR